MNVVNQSRSPVTPAMPTLAALFVVPLARRRAQVRGSNTNVLEQCMHLTHKYSRNPGHLHTRRLC